MKVFAATLIILFFMLLFIFVNRAFILSVASDLNERLDVIETSNDKIGSINEAEKYWKRVRLRASLSVSHEIIEDVDRRFVGLKSYTEKDRAADFQCELLLFRDVIKKMIRLERVIK